MELAIPFWSNIIFNRPKSFDCFDNEIKFADFHSARSTSARRFVELSNVAGVESK